MHICISKLTTIASDNGLLPGPRQAIIYINQSWNIANWTLGNKLQWNRNRNLYIYIQENALENVVWKMAAILSRPQWIKSEFSPKYLQHTPHSSRETVEYLENHDIFHITGPLCRESTAERRIQDLCYFSSVLHIYIDGSMHWTINI